MTAILIKNARIWTTGDGLIDEGFVVVRDDTIAQVGPMGELQQPQEETEVIDAGGRLVLPGFVCAHTHLYSALARGMALSGVAPESFGDILEQIWWRLDKALDEESVYYSALVGGMDFLKNGVTTIVDHHASPYHIRGSLGLIKRAVVDELGLRSCLCYEISDRDGKKRAEEGIAENIAFFDETSAGSNGLLAALIGLHASFTLSDETLMKLNKGLGDRRVGFHLHLAEGPEDQEDSLPKYGKRVTERLQDHRILNDQTILAHGVHLDEKEKDILAQTGAMVVHNPQSNMNNAVGIADIPGMLNRGILVGLGNDGLGYEMLSDLRAMFLVHKLINQDPKVMSLDHAYKVFFESNYKIARRLFGVDVGSIRPGYKADLILVDYLPPTPLHEDNFIGHLVFGLAGNLQVLTTIVNGRVLMRDRKLLSVDAKSAYAKARAAAQRLWSRIV
ncbi:MAG: putative aminohydrolase SsnA [Candidatus Bipolaricaulia bacterium]